MSDEIADLLEEYDNPFVWCAECGWDLVLEDPRQDFPMYCPSSSHESDDTLQSRVRTKAFANPNNPTDTKSDKI